jgi:hypothetical protein
MKKIFVIFVISSLCGLVNAAPNALYHVSYTDTYFGGSTYIDNQSAFDGSIVLYPSGPVGNYADYVNTNQYASGDSLSFPYTIGKEGTIAMFMRVPTGCFYNYAGVFDTSGGGNEWESWFYSDGRVGFRAKNGSTTLTYNLKTNVGENVWFHIAYVWKQQTPDANKVDMTLIVNGVQVNTNTQNWINPASTFFVGCGNIGNQKFNSDMDEFYIFDKAMTAAEVDSLRVRSLTNKLATDPLPYVGAKTTMALDALRWTAPSAVTSPNYNVYYSTDPNLPASSKVLNGTTATSYTPTASYIPDVRHYWRVDVNDGGTIYQGVVWTFVPKCLTGDLNKDGYVNFKDFQIIAANWNHDTIDEGYTTLVDNFENYNSKADMNAYWTQGVYGGFPNSSGTVNIDLVSMTSDPNYASKQMKYNFNYSILDMNNNPDIDGWSTCDFIYVFDTPIDLTQYDELRYDVYREANNPSANWTYLYVYDKSITGDPCTVAAGMGSFGSVVSTAGVWQQITNNLHDLQFYSWTGTPYTSFSQFTQTTAFLIGAIGKNPAAEYVHPVGTIYFDNFELVRLDRYTGPQEGDINGDYMVDLEDLALLATDWLQFPN